MADQVGGFENLGKTLAYLYIGNKALRIGAGAVKVGGGIAQAAGSLLGNRGVAGKAAGAINAASATPVFVTNWPDTPGISDMASSPKNGKLPKAGGIAGAAAPWLQRAGGIAAIAQGGLIAYQLVKMKYDEIAEVTHRIRDPEYGKRARFEDKKHIIELLGNSQAKAKIEVEIKTRNTRVNVRGHENIDVYSSGRVMPNF